MRTKILKRWNDVGDKLVALVEAVPEAALEQRPADGTRTFAEQVRHVVFWNQYVAGTLRGASPDGGANEIPASAAPDRRRLAAALKASQAEVAAAFGGANDEADAVLQIVPFLEHNCEHYGQLAVYARLQGVVPPASR